MSCWPVSLASGYYKATGRAQIVFLPTSLGVQKASMALGSALQERAAEAYGGTGERVQKPDELSAALWRPPEAVASGPPSYWTSS